MTKTLALLLALSVSAVVNAQTVTGGKIAVLDTQGAILSTDEAQKRLKALSAQPEFDGDKKQYEKLKKDYEDMVKQLQKDAAVMSAEQKDAQRKKLEAKASDIEYLGRKLQGKQQDVVQTYMQEEEAKFRKAVADIIKSENIGLLLDARTVMHADNSYNITSKVTDALNKANSQ
ncbi:MAG TPA: OmpH family outer membrane protein [Spongiibacteraceae bacterium]|nr:OmpH family outer membrane protein [Spongiibacteraceae bacterium]